MRNVLRQSHRRRERHFAPNDLDNMTLWLDAGNIFGVADGGTVAIWPDKGPNSNNATGVNSPTWHENIVNGNPVVRFARASTQQFTLSSAIDNPIYTYFAVLKFSDVTTRSSIIGGALAGNPSWFAMVSTGIMKTERSGQVAIGTGSQDVSGSFAILMAQYESPNWNFRLNGALDASGTKSTTIVSAWDYVGNDSYADRKLNGDIAELITYSDYKSIGDILKVERYLDNKYSIY